MCTPPIKAEIKDFFGLKEKVAKLNEKKKKKTVLFNNSI
jgi:hypothetical protein